jgi:HAD superfamily hydrolase (TIGR01509 family)
MIERGFFRGYLFDLDGVLINSMTQHAEAFRIALGEYGLFIGDVEIAGRSTVEIIKEVQANNPYIKIPISELVPLKQKIARELIQTAGIEVMTPHVNEVISCLSSNSKVGICTSGSKASLELFLSLLTCDIEFNVLLCADDVVDSKPNPEIYLKGAARMGVASKDILVVEDSPSGIQAALSAGCQVAHFAPPLHNDHNEIRCQYKIESLQELIPLSNRLNR